MELAVIFTDFGFDLSFRKRHFTLLLELPNDIYNTYSWTKDAPSELCIVLQCRLLLLGIAEHVGQTLPLLKVSHEGSPRMVAGAASNVQGQ